MSPTVSWPAPQATLRERPTRQTGDERSRSSIGSSRPPRGRAGCAGSMRAARVSAAVTRSSAAAVQSDSGSERSGSSNRVGEISARRQPERPVGRSELLERDGAGFVEPAQVGAAGPATSDSTSTQPPASDICRRRFSAAGSASAGGAASNGSRSASEAMPCCAARAPARVSSCDFRPNRRGSSPAATAARASAGSEDVVQPFSAPAAGGACFGASLVSVGRLAASHSTMPPLSAAAR